MQKQPGQGGSSATPKSIEGNDRQPESLSEFDSASRSGGVKPRDQGTGATAQTTPKRDNPADKDATATRILQAGVEKNPAKATEAAQQRTDPRIDKTGGSGRH